MSEAPHNSYLEKKKREARIKADPYGEEAVQAALEFNRGTRYPGSTSPRRQPPKPKRQLLRYASMDEAVAKAFGFYRYMMDLDRLPPTDLADEYDRLKQDGSEISEHRMGLLRKELEKRGVWKTWEHFVRWCEGDSTAG